MTLISDKQWEEFKELGEKMPPLPEDLDLQLTRKVLQNPNNLEFFFDGLRRDLKEKITFCRESKANIFNLSSNNDTKHILHMILMLEERNMELFQEHVDLIESLAFQNVELRKDLNRLIRISKPTKNKTKEFENLLKTISNKEKENSKFAKDYQQDKPYLRQFKDFLDHEAGTTSEQ